MWLVLQNCFGSYIKKIMISLMTVLTIFPNIWPAELLLSNSNNSSKTSNSVQS